MITSLVENVEVKKQWEIPLKNRPDIYIYRPYILYMVGIGLIYGIGTSNFFGS
jgi:hypothetical protein